MSTVRAPLVLESSGVAVVFEHFGDAESILWFQAGGHYPFIFAIGLRQE